MDKTQFLDKYRALQTPANVQLLTVLKLWLLEGKSDDDIAEALGKDRSTATRKIGNICKYFGTHEKVKTEQRQQLVLLFRTYCSDFEVHSSLYPDWGEFSSGDRPSIPIKNENISSHTLHTSPDLLARYDDHEDQPNKKKLRRADIPKSQFYGLPHQNSKFIGRDENLNELYQYMSFDYEYSIVIVDGIGGIGKTSLVIEAAYRCLEEMNGMRGESLPTFDVTIFITFKKESLSSNGIEKELYFATTLNDIFHAFEESLGYESILRAPTEGEQIKNAKSCLERDDRKILLIIDDVQSIDDNERKTLLQFVRILPRTVKIILTTRIRALGEGQHIRLEQLNENEALDLIDQQIKLSPRIFDIDMETRKKLYECYLRVPLALVFTVGQIANGYAIDDILDTKCPAFKEDIAYFCFQKTIELLKFKNSKILLSATSLFEYPPSVDAVKEVAALSCTEAEVSDAFAELKTCALMHRNGFGRCVVLPIIREYVLGYCRRKSQDKYKTMEHRRYQFYLDFAKKYGSNDSGSWWIPYSKIRDEWDNLCFEIKECSNNERYEEAKALWNHLNHFADLSGYWRERLYWLDWLIDQSQKREDWEVYIQCISRKAWTLTMIGITCYGEVDNLLKEAWDRRNEVSLVIQDYIAHNRIVFLLRMNEYSVAEEVLLTKNEIVHKLIEKYKEFPEESDEVKRIARIKINSLRDQAKLDFKRGSLEEAKLRYLLVKNDCAKINWKRIECYAKNELADICLELNDLPEAQGYLQSGEYTAIVNRNYRRYAFYQKSFAKLYTKMGDYINASKSASKSVVMFKRLGMTEEESKLLKFYQLTSAHLKSAESELRELFQ